MKSLVIDYGNTRAKVGIFDKRELLQEHVFENLEAVLQFVKNSNVHAAIFSSVNENTDVLMASATHIDKKFMLSHMLPLPIVNSYATPETLGVDRLASVCGARIMFPHEACLVIDSGTCITYDFIDTNGIYKGGAIAPGLSMRLRAMHEFTARLPLVEVNENPALIGSSTVSCMQSGALNGMAAEIDGMISRYQQHYPHLKVILCGGDTHFFENSLKGTIFAVQNLVLKGLNSILLHNVSE